MQIVPRLSVAELEERDRGCGDAVECSHWLCVVFSEQRRSTQQVAEVTSYSQHGPETLLDYRHQHLGLKTGNHPDFCTVRVLIRKLKRVQDPEARLTLTWFRQ